MIVKRQGFREAVAAYCFLAPNLTGFLALTFLPVLASLILSFTRYDMISGEPPQFVGIRNYVNLLQDRGFWYYLYNTVFLMTAIPLSIGGSLLLAVVLNRKVFRGKILYRTLYFLPSMCVPVSIFVLWQWVYNTDYGLLNWFLSGPLGIDNPPQWLTSTAWSKPSMMIVGLWAGIGGFNMILYLAALQGIPPQLYEASEMDGANGWQKFRYITWPMVSPTTFFIVIMSIIGGFQGSFDIAYMMTRGGPAGSTTTIMYYIWQQGFAWLRMGYASAIAWILFLLVFTFTLLSWRSGGKVVHYD